jgi:hypothetical protein
MASNIGHDENILSAKAHVRGNWVFIWYGEKLYAIAVERCICLP